MPLFGLTTGQDYFVNIFFNSGLPASFTSELLTEILADARSGTGNAGNVRRWLGRNVRFHPSKDEYLCCYFKSAERDLTTDSLFVEVDGFGTHALVVAANEGGYQANCLRPPGLDPGRHEVRIRTRNSGLSNAVRFIMLDESGRDISTTEEALPGAAPELCSVEFRPSGDLRLAVNPGGSLVCYFRSPAQLVAPGDVTIEWEGQERRAHTISSLGDGVWQANILLEEVLAEGSSVRIRLADGEWSLALPARAMR